MQVSIKVVKRFIIPGVIILGSLTFMILGSEITLIGTRSLLSSKLIALFFLVLNLVVMQLLLISLK